MIKGGSRKGRYDGSVFYVFSAAIRLLSIVGAHTKVPQTVTLVPSASVCGARVRSGANKSSKHAARCIVRDIMQAGLDLCKLRASHLFSIEAARSRIGTGAGGHCQRICWAYAAFRIRYLTRL